MTAFDPTALRLPGRIQSLRQPPAPTAGVDPAAYRAAFRQPTAGSDLRSLAASAQRVVIVICDRTRPVPYHGDDPQGLLAPLLAELHDAGIAAEAITVVVALGTHEESDPDGWLRSALGPGIVASGVRFVYHDCRSDELPLLGEVPTAAGPVPVHLHPELLNADLIIPTGFIEPHFMAGASGGAKLIIPGCASVRSILGTIHGPTMMTHPDADLLRIDSNPLQELFFRTADLLAEKGPRIFNLNVTMHGGHVNGIFTGELRPSFQAGVAHLATYAEATVPEAADYVIFQAGHITGSNCYQTAKAFFGASRILAAHGRIILFSGIRDGMGAGRGFTDSMQLLRQLGAEAYLQRVCEPDYTYQAEEWQTVMLARAMRCSIRGTAIPDHEMVVATPWSEQDRHADFPLRFLRWDGTTAGAQALLDEELAQRDDQAIGAVIDDETVVPTIASGVTALTR